MVPLNPLDEKTKKPFMLQTELVGTLGKTRHHGHLYGWPESKDPSTLFQHLEPKARLKRERDKFINYKFTTSNATPKGFVGFDIDILANLKTYQPQTIQVIPNLPIITACVQEVLRWRPLVPAGIPCVLIQDDVFEQYYFPKGTQFSIPHLRFMD
jgi:Cytochrome P450